MVYDIIVNDIIPIFVIMLLGYMGAKMHSFSPDQTQALNKVVLDIALPAALFASITRASREMLFSDLTLTIVSLVGVVALFMISFFLCWKLWKHNVQEAAVCALIAGSPTIGFLGFAVLDPIFGATTETGLVVAIVAIVVNAVTIPIGFYLLNVGAPEGSEMRSGSSLSAVINALKQPVVWSPLLAVAIVLCGFHLPEYLYPSFELIAKANSGVAVFAAGLALASVSFSIGFEILWNTFYRVLLSPFVIAIFGAICGITGDKLSMLVLACALPPAFSGIIISSRYQIYVRDGASSLAVSTLAFAFAAPFWIWFTPIVASWF